MSRKSKIDPVLKVTLVESYLLGEIYRSEATRQAGLRSPTAFDQWVSICKNEGPAGLLDRSANRHYTRELKLAAVHAFLNGEGSLAQIASRYGLRAENQLHDWIKAYTTHGEILSHTDMGGSCMSQARQTTQKERLEIVKDCLANGRDYGAIAQKYNCSYQQVRSWVHRYEKMGDAGLEDRRGKRAGTQPARTPEEELRDKIAELERRNRDLQMENDLLKKVRELETRDRCL